MPVPPVAPPVVPPVLPPVVPPVVPPVTPPVPVDPDVGGPYVVLPGYGFTTVPVGFGLYVVPTPAPGL